MGWEHSMTIDAVPAERVRAAADEFWAWAVAEYPDEHPAAFTDNGWMQDAARHLVPCVFRSPDDVVFWQDDDSCIRVREYFEESDWPTAGEALLWWMEIPWLRRVPSELMSNAYRIFDQHDVPDVWLGLIGDGTAMADQVFGAFERMLPRGAVIGYDTRNGEHVAAIKE